LKVMAHKKKKEPESILLHCDEVPGLALTGI
jgi:hypothetical protein